jgi:hypothetical protein
MISHILLFFALFAIGPLIEAATRLWRVDDPRPFVPWSGIALGLVFGIGGIIVRLSGPDSAGAAGGSDNHSFALSLLGLVISVVTGLTVASAWRAIDDAGKAAKMVKDSGTAIEKDMLDFGFHFRRMAAYLEARDRAREFVDRDDCRDRGILRGEVISLFVHDETDGLVRAIENRITRLEIAREIGPEGVRFLEFVEDKCPMSRADRDLVRGFRIAASEY